MNSLQRYEQRRIRTAARYDRKWWGDAKNRFPSLNHSVQAEQNGLLVLVEVPNQFFTCPSDLRSNRSLRLLRPNTIELMNEVFSETEKLIGFSRRYRYAVTSMYRSDEEQKKTLEGPDSYRAAKPGTSSHAAGTAFDISIRSHYIIDEEGKILGARTWDETIAFYNPILFEALASVLERRSYRGECNLIIENAVEDENTSPTCFHVCVSPEYSPRSR